MSNLAVGDLVVLDTPNPLYCGLIVEIVDLGDPWERERDRAVVQVAIPVRAVQMDGPPGACIWRRMRPSSMTRIEDLVAAADCEG